MHMYPPCPVSMQVALPAQGLDEHRRVSVVKQVKKKKISSCTFSLLLLSCFCACFLLLPPFPSSHSCSHHSILSPRRKLRTLLAQASSLSAPAEEKRRVSSHGSQQEKHKYVLFDEIQQVVVLNNVLVIKFLKNHSQLTLNTVLCC